MFAEDYVLRLDIQMHDLEGMHNGQLFFKMTYILYWKLTFSLTHLSGVLDAVVVNQQVEAQGFMNVRSALKGFANPKNSPLLYYCWEYLLKRSLFWKIKTFQTEYLLSKVERVDIGKAAADHLVRSQYIKLG